MLKDGRSAVVTGYGLIFPISLIESSPEYIP